MNRRMSQQNVCACRVYFVYCIFNKNVTIHKFMAWEIEFVEDGKKEKRGTDIKAIHWHSAGDYVLSTILVVERWSHTLIIIHIKYHWLLTLTYYDYFWSEGERQTAMAMVILVLSYGSMFDMHSIDILQWWQQPQAQPIKVTTTFICFTFFDSPSRGQPSGYI